MAMIKCKMCGGDLNVTEGMTVAECEYCGTRQTVPNVDNEKKLTLFSRANRLRLACEFDKAAGVYENIVAEFPEEAEAYWGLVLCRYGIEYVDDPATGKKVPTCHRSSFDSILEDSDFEQACENADAVARRVYREEAKAIEDIRKGILEVSGKEPPYDIFICYKETDDSGERTVDSVLAQDVYDALTEKGYRVFFSRITLEDKLGTEYEPYIFAALNSAKVMLVFGTDYEYFNAVWVKNEWSRYLKLMAQDKSKHLIPCYKNVDAYDMPKEFQKLQGQDMGKVGAVQDLLRGIDKLLGKGQAAQAAAQTSAQAAGGPTADSLLKRGQMFLEDGDWDSADEYFDKVLDMAPECAEAYVGKFCAARQYRKIAELARDSKKISGEASRLWERVMKFVSLALRSELEDYLAASVRLAQEKVQKEEAARREVDKKAEAARREAERKAEAARQKREQKKAQLETIRPSAQGLLAVESRCTIGLRSDGTVVAAGWNKTGQCNVSDWQDIVAVCAGYSHTVGLRSDSTVVAVGRNDYGQCDVSDWRDIVAVCVGYSHTVGLRSDGTVIAIGENYTGQCNVSDWRDIVAICAGDRWTVGLRSDGTAVAVGERDCRRQCNVSDWQDIVAVCTGYSRTVGLRSDGTVVAAGESFFVARNTCKISDWRDIVAVCAGESHAVGLRSDGTVVAVGGNTYGECNVSDWCDIVAVCAGYSYTVGLRSDGTVVAVGHNLYGQCNVSDWCDIVAVCAGDFYTVGLRSDGTVVAVGHNLYGQCGVSDWRLFPNAETLAEERENVRRRGEEKARKMAEARAQRRAALEAEQADLQTELSNLKGLFTGKRRKEIEARLAEIKNELKKL